MAVHLNNVPIKSPSGITLTSYNMKGHGQDRIAYIKSLLNVSDIVIVQEHWYLNSQLQDFQNNFDDAKIILKSGMDDDVLLVGRPFGGCAILYKESQFRSVTPVQSAHKRVVGALLNCSACKVLLINVYMPCDSQAVDRIYDDTLDEVNLIIRSHSDVDYVIVGGDFNTDMMRSSYHTRRLREFCDDEDLFNCSNSSLSPNDFTFESATGHRSLIDHFLLSLNFADLPFISSSVRYDGDNLSDHNALLLKLRLPVSNHDRGNGRSTETPQPHVVWRKATKENLQNYRLSLELRLQELHLPVECSACSDDACCRLISQYYDDLSNSCIMSANECIPRTSKRKPVAGWSEHVKPYKERSIFWHSLWRSNGFPRQGEVYNIMRKTRAEYKRISRHVIRSQEKLKMERMAAGVLNNQDRIFWDEIKRISHSKVQLTQTVENAHDEDSINAVFTEKYRELYKSVPFDPTEMDALYQNICGKVGSCSQNECLAVHNISAGDVTKAIRNLRPYKGDAFF